MDSFPVHVLCLFSVFSWSPHVQGQCPYLVLWMLTMYNSTVPFNSTERSVSKQWLLSVTDPYSFLFICHLFRLSFKPEIVIVVTVEKQTKTVFLLFLTSLNTFSFTRIYEEMFKLLLLSMECGKCEGSKIIVCLSFIIIHPNPFIYFTLNTM